LLSDLSGLEASSFDGFFFSGVFGTTGSGLASNYGLIFGCGFY
jgi:hypothetical protein